MPDHTAFRQIMKMTKTNTNETVTDIDFADRAVENSSKKGFVTMFMIMLGFTFFSASMWAGQQMAAGLDFYDFIGSLILGGIILGAYTGLLGYVGAKTGLSMDLLAKKAFGEKGSYLSSALLLFLLSETTWTLTDLPDWTFVPDFSWLF